MLTIIVKPKRERVGFSCGSVHTVFKTFVRVGGMKLPLADCRGIDETDVEIVLKLWLFRQRLSLTPEVKQAILKFVGYYSTRMELDFDCYAFVNMAFGVQQHPVEHSLGYWNTEALEGDPEPGQAIFLVTEQDRHFYHAAIHLGHGLYLSVYGRWGGLEISILPDMLRDFGAKDVLRATPRGKAATYS